MTDRIEEIKMQGALVDALRAGVTRLKQEGVEALAYSLDQDRCNRKYAAADVVNRFRKHAIELVGTDAFPIDQVLFMIEITRLSGVAVDSTVLYSGDQLAAIAELVAGGWLKVVNEYFSPTRTVTFYTVDFAYESLDRSNG